MYGVRAISPLLIALALLVVVVLRQPLPCKGFTDDDEDADSSTKGGSKGKGATTTGSSGGKDADAGATEQAAARDDSAHGSNEAADDLEQGGTDQVRFSRNNTTKKRTQKRSFVLAVLDLGTAGGLGVETVAGLQAS